MTVIWSPPRWHYWTHPNNSWMENFCRDVCGPDVIMWPEETDAVTSWFTWSSHHLDDVSSSKEFLDRSISLKALFDGSMYITIGQNYHPFDLVQPTAEARADDAMVRSLPYPGDVTVEPFSASHLAAPHDLDGRLLNKPLVLYLFLARYDEVTKAILKYTGVQGLSYMTLYAFRDWMKGDGWDDKRIAQEAGWSTSRFRDFTETANNPAYLGPYCRHGGGSPRLPKRPMPLDEANQGMCKAVHQFLLHRSKVFNLRSRWNSLKG